MEASLGKEFSSSNNEKYPKQLAYSSKKHLLTGRKFPKKSILGRYLRNRLGIGINELITMETLFTYGRKYDFIIG